MASRSDIDTVRKNVAEPSQDTFTDAVIGAAVDRVGVAGASAELWSQKAAALAELVDVSEAGASHKFSDLHKNALAMSAHWSKLALVATGVVSERIRIKQIVRSDG